MENTISELAKKIGATNATHGLDQRILVIQECAETIESLTDEIRNRPGRSEHTIEELCDIIASSYVLLVMRGVTDLEIGAVMRQKYDRAINRFEESGIL